MFLGKQQRFTCEKWVQTVPDMTRFVSYTTIPRTTLTLKDPSKVRQCIWFKGDIALSFPSKLALGNVTFVSCFIVRFCETHFSCTWKHIHVAQMAPPKRLFFPLYPKSQISISSQSASDEMILSEVKVS